MNLLRVLLRSVCGSHPSDVPPKSKISVQIEQNGNGRRSGAFLHISFKNSSICKAFGVRQRPPQGAEFVCVPCGANNSKSVGSNTVRVRPPPSAPKIMPRSTSGALFLVRREGEPATCGSCKDARWRSHRVGARTRRPQRPQFDNPASPHFCPLNKRGIIFGAAGGELALCGSCKDAR